VRGKRLSGPHIPRQYKKSTTGAVILSNTALRERHGPTSAPVLSGRRSAAKPMSNSVLTGPMDGGLRVCFPGAQDQESAAHISLNWARRWLGQRQVAGGRADRRSEQGRIKSTKVCFGQFLLFRPRRKRLKAHAHRKVLRPESATSHFCFSLATRRRTRIGLTREAVSARNEAQDTGATHVAGVTPNSSGCSDQLWGNTNL